MFFVAGNMESKTLTADRFEKDYYIVEKLVIGSEYYLVRNSANEYRIFIKLSGDIVLYTLVDEIVIS
jgi:hypothetical protein